jgi:hypothetical protein
MNEDLNTRRDEERRARTLPTRDTIMKPTYTMHERRKAEDQARLDAHRRGQARDLFVRTHAPGTPVPAELQEPSEGGK